MFAGPRAEPPAGPRAEPDTGSRAEPDTGSRAEPDTGSRASLMTEPDDQPLAGHDAWRTPGAAPPLWNDRNPHPAGHGSGGSDTLLLEPEPPGTWRPGIRRGLISRRTATIAVPVIVLVAVAVLALALLTGHGPKFGPLADSRPPNQGQGPAAQPALTIGMYPGQQQRGVFQTVNRIVASGDTIVTMGSQTSDGVVRQQFFVSGNGGASWRLAPVHAAEGGPGVQPPLGHPAARLAGGPGGWLAVGPQAIWTSPNGLSWTLAATHGITPMLPGDGMWVLNSTSDGFVAAGVAAAPDHTTQAVIWTSRDGVTWQRKTAAQLGLAGPARPCRASPTSRRGGPTR